MNRTTKHAMVFLLTMACGGVKVDAQAMPLSPPPTTQPVHVTSTVINELDIPEGATIEQVLAMLQEKVPAFHYVVSPEGNWKRQKLPKMHLANFTLGSAFHVLGHFVGEVGSNFQIESLNDPDDGGGQQIFAVGRFGEVSPAYTRVEVFSLSGAIDRQYYLDGARGIHGPIPEARKRAMASVLSLVEIAVKQWGITSPPLKLSVHDDTETLIVTGTDSDLIAVTQALKALDAPVDQNLLRRLQSENDALQRYNENMAEMLHAARAASDAADKAASAAESKNAQPKRN